MKNQSLKIFNCPLCFSDEFFFFFIGNKLIRHLDFNLVDAGETLIVQCIKCKTVFRQSLTANQNLAESMFKSEEYKEKVNCDHFIFINEFQKLVSQQFLQARIIKKNLKKEKLDVLDIGCLDGKLLSELNKLYPNGIFYGFDIDDNTKGEFPKQKNFKFFHSDLGQIKEKFDLIIFSHSIQYIHNIHKYFSHVIRLLKDTGIIYVQVPDYSKKPCTLFMYDHLFHFNSTNISNFCKYFGFKIDLIDTTWFPRDIVGVAYRNKYATGKNNIYDCDNSLKQIINYVLKLNEGLLEYEQKYNKLVVLGTTVEAAYVSAILGNSIAFYIDENHTKVNKLFNNKKVCHPKHLSHNDNVIIPYGKTSLSIKEIFVNKYNGNFLTI